MARIDGTDRVLLQLQEQLLRLSQERQVKQGATTSGQPAPGTPLQRMQRLANSESVEDEELRRSVVRSVLLDQFGDRLGADPNFEAMTSQVFAMLERSDEGRQLIGNAMSQLLGINASG